MAVSGEPAQWLWNDSAGSSTSRCWKIG
jgi:hypothetical protein